MRCKRHETDEAGAAGCEYCWMKQESAAYVEQVSEAGYFESLKNALTGPSRQMSMAQFARLAGCSPSNISHFMKYPESKGGVPKYMWRAAARYLGIGSVPVKPIRPEDEWIFQ